MFMRQLKKGNLALQGKISPKCNKTRPQRGQVFISHANYLAKAFTLRAKRDFLRPAAFLWYTWFAAA